MTDLSASRLSALADDPRSAPPPEVARLLADTRQYEWYGTADIVADHIGWIKEIKAALAAAEARVQRDRAVAAEAIPATLVDTFRRLVAEAGGPDVYAPNAPSLTWRNQVIGAMEAAIRAAGDGKPQP